MHEEMSSAFSYFVYLIGRFGVEFHVITKRIRVTSEETLNYSDDIETRTIKVARGTSEMSSLSLTRITNNVHQLLLI